MREFLLTNPSEASCCLPTSWVSAILQPIGQSI